MNHLIALTGGVVGILVHRWPRDHFEQDCTSSDTKKVPNGTDEPGLRDASRCAGRKMEFDWSIIQHTLRDGICQGWHFFCRLSGIVVNLWTNMLCYLFLRNLEGLRVCGCKGSRGDDSLSEDGLRSETLPDPHDDQLQVKLDCGLVKYDLLEMWQRRCLYRRLPLTRNRLLAGLYLCNRCGMVCSDIDGHVPVQDVISRHPTHVTAALPADPRDESLVEELQDGHDLNLGMQQDRSRFEVLLDATNEADEKKASEKALMELVNHDLQKQILDLKDRLHHAEADLYASRQYCERLQATCTVLKTVAREFMCALDDLEWG